jgi:hypothetical protein
MPRPAVAANGRRISSWEFVCNLLMRHVRFSPQLGEQPREFNVLLRTHAPQQGVSYSIASSTRSRNGSGILSRRALAVVSSVPRNACAGWSRWQAPANVVLSNGPEIDLS